MATLADLNSRRDALVNRITSLRSRVTAGDRTVEYDLDQADRALSLLDREIKRAETAEGGRRRSRAVRLSLRTGY